MSRIFGYARCSTDDQNTDAQLKELNDRVPGIKCSRFVHEIVSGGVPAMQRQEFAKLIDRLEEGDTLVVAKLDRLGRDNIDVQTTINALLERGIKVRCLDIPVEDLTSAEGKLMLQLMASFAEFEKSRIRERTLAGMKASHKTAGRPEAIKTTKKVQAEKAKGLTQSEVARALGISIPTVKRHWNKSA